MEGGRMKDSQTKRSDQITAFHVQDGRAFHVQARLAFHVQARHRESRWRTPFWKSELSFCCDRLMRLHYSFLGRSSSLMTR